MIIKKAVVYILMVFAVFAASPLFAAASVLEATATGVTVLGLPAPVITGIDAESGVISLKADGFINSKTALVAVVALKDGTGNVLDTVEQKVSDPDNVRVSLKKAAVQSGYSVEAWFTNYGIAGNKTSQMHENPPVILSIDVEEVNEAGLWGAFVNLFDKTAYNTKIKVTINAVDDIELEKLHYCITQDAAIPDDAVWIETDGVLYFDNEMDGVIHAKATDKRQYVSEPMSRTIRIDRTGPELTYELAERENEYAPYIIKVSAKDDAGTVWFSGIDYIENPLGAREHTDYIEYAVYENGSYSFKTADMTVNETSLTVVIDDIVQIVREDWENNQVVIDAVLHASGKQRIEDVKYADLQRITFLDLSAKRLSELPDILGLALNLEYLDLRGNEYEKIPDCVYRMAKLKHLYLCNNNLTEIGDEISNLTQLETFYVTFNYIDFDGYSLPLIVGDYLDIGNFTSSEQSNQYSFDVEDAPEADELIGNTVQINVNWFYDGQQIDRLEDHRKALYMGLYPQYRTYRPLLYRYEVQNGEIKAAAPDYVQVFLNNTGVMAAKLKLGG